MPSNSIFSQLYHCVMGSDATSGRWQRRLQPYQLLRNALQLADRSSFGHLSAWLVGWRLLTAEPLAGGRLAGCMYVCMCRHCNLYCCYCGNIRVHVYAYVIGVVVWRILCIPHSIRSFTFVAIFNANRESEM